MKLTPRSWRSEYLNLIPWSEQQLEVFTQAVRSKDHLLLEACAGAGKTTTIMGLIAALPTSVKVQVIAFNRHIAAEIKDDPRIPATRVRVSTSHGVGLSMLMRFWRGQKPEVDPNKYYKIADQLLTQIELGVTPQCLEFQIPDERETFLRSVAEVVEFAHNTLTEPTAAKLSKMASWYGLDLPGDKRLKQELFSMVEVAIDIGESDAMTKYTISYSDMVYLPVRFKLYAPGKHYIIVDEAQDLSPAQIAIVNKFVLGGARLIAVGDPSQSIYGFCGGDPYSLEKIENKFSPLRLDLDVCYRCGSSILELAQTFKPSITPAPGADRGAVMVLHPDSMAELVQPEDLVICRFNAPLVHKCIEFYSKGIKAGIIGGDLANALRGLLYQASALEGSLIDNLHRIAAERALRLSHAGRETEALEVEGLKNALLHLIADYHTTTVKQLDRLIGVIFNPDDPDIKMASIHRAKGTEADRVWLLACNLLPRTNPVVIPWQNQQENNLTYVALTRAKKRLYLVPYAMSDEDGNVDDLVEEPYGGLTLPREVKRIAPPPKVITGQLSLF